MSDSAQLLPPLYFHVRSGHESRLLPSELLQRCLTDYADWGDLAKLACVQRRWSNLMYDAAGACPSARWELAQALERGTHGLQEHPARALELYLELSNVLMEQTETTADGNTSLTFRKRDDSRECFAPSMRRLAHCYLTGHGLASADLDRGLAWLQACHLLGGDADAAHDVALMYEYGTHGVDVDVVKAVEWFRKAAEAGHMEAMAELGLCYEIGAGVEQSDETALDWYMAAAEKGHLTAKYSVGEAYEEARGVPQSDAEACLWYYKAAIEGDEDSRKALRRLEAVARIVIPGAGVLLDG